MTFCESISKRVDEGIRTATEFDVTSALLVCFMTTPTLLSNL
jgi:hypothetical protein